MKAFSESAFRAISLGSKQDLHHSDFSSPADPRHVSCKFFSELRWLWQSLNFISALEVRASLLSGASLGMRHREDHSTQERQIHQMFVGISMYACRATAGARI